MMTKQVSSNTRKVAMQHQQLAKNTLFAYGNPKLQACTHKWGGKTTIESISEINDKIVKEECDYAIEAVSAYLMDAKDQLLFLIILYLMRIEQSRTVVEHPKELNTTGWKNQSKTLQLQTNLSEICRIMNLTPTGGNINRIKQRLKRLANVSLTCEIKGKKRKRTWSSSLLHWELDEEYVEGSQRILKITLPAIIASAAYKQGMQIHSSHDLDELLQLPKESILVHTALSSRIRPGKVQRLKLETLIDYMQFSNKTQLKKQKFLVKKAVENLTKLTNWKVSHEVNNEVYKFWRPQLIEEPKQDKIT